MISEKDSNPQYPFEVYTLSRRALSTTQTSLLLNIDLTDFENRERRPTVKQFFSYILETIPVSGTITY